MKVSIICGSPSSEFLAPFTDESWEIWVLGNRLNRFLDKGLRVTRVFEIHDNLSEHKDIDKYVDWLLSKNIPMVVAEKFPRTGTNIKVFDYQRSEALFGSLYLTSSPSYMMSQAISEGATEIGVYGVDLAISDHEYFWQRPCMEAWIGFAKGRGIKVTIPEISNVGKAAYTEGRDWNGIKNEYGKRVTGTPPFTQSEFEKMATMHVDKMAAVRQEIQRLEDEFHTNSGAHQVYETMAKVARAIEAGNEIKKLSNSASIK